MCGIVAYIGKKNAVDFLLNALQALEYRGYDSAGIAVIDQNDGLIVKKSQGKLINLLDLVAQDSPKGKIGVGHTRWATHGIPSDLNAHPHSGNQSKVVLVHNGIISNYLEIKNYLKTEHNICFQSETDTEVAANLIEIYLNKGFSLREAIAASVQRLEGSYALCVISPEEDDKVVLTCKEAPLVIGLGKEGDLYCASDGAALLKYTDRIIRLKDHEIAELHNDGSFKIYDPNSQLVKEPQVQVLNFDPLVLDKAGYKHYLLKEIHEQPAILRRLYSYHIRNDGHLTFPDMDESLLNTGIDRIMILGCGTAFYAGVIGKYLIESLSGIPVELEFASEMLTRPQIIANPKTLLIAISQSGETADTLAAVKSVLAQGAKLIAINNRPESTLASLAHGSSIFTQGDIEVSVAATKSFTAQLFCLYCLAIKLAEIRSTQSSQNLLWIKKQLQTIPQLQEQILMRADEYQNKILNYAQHEAFIFLGRGIHYALALEGALKLKELTYVQASGYAAGEMKHGPIATLDHKVPTISLLLQGITYQKTLHNLMEAKTRGASSIAIVNDHETLSEIDTALHIPLSYQEEPPFKAWQDLLNPFTATIPLQLIAYYLAQYLGKDVDQPRNLAKSVTVE